MVRKTNHTLKGRRRIKSHSEQYNMNVYLQYDYVCIMIMRAHMHTGYSCYSLLCFSGGENHRYPEASTDSQMTTVIIVYAKY